MNKRYIYTNICNGMITLLVKITNVIGNKHCINTFIYLFIIFPMCNERVHAVYTYDNV